MQSRSEKDLARVRIEISMEGGPTMKQADKTHRTDAQVFTATARKQIRSVGAKEHRQARDEIRRQRQGLHPQERPAESRPSTQAGDQTFGRNEALAARWPGVTFTAA
jgi:hypothetical protein